MLLIYIFERLHVDTEHISKMFAVQSICFLNLTTELYECHFQESGLFYIFTTFMSFLPAA